MMHRVNYTNTTAMDLQSAAELRRSQASSASATQKPGAQYNFAEVFGGPNWGAQEEAASKAALSPPPSGELSSRGALHTAIATATAVVIGNGTGGRRLSPIQSPLEAPAQTSAPAPATSATTSTATAAATVTTPTPGVGALVTAIMNGTFQPTNVSDPSKLQEITPLGTDYMPGFYYASDQTASQLAQLLGGQVVQMPAFGQDKGWSEPNANFIQLPDGQTFNAADVAYYAKAGSQGAAQLTADITATINQGSAWTSYYQQGGQMPSFAPGYVGPPIAGSTYDASMISATGNVINPAMQQSGIKGT
jgi:hypothetical protein